MAVQPNLNVAGLLAALTANPVPDDEQQAGPLTAAGGMLYDVNGNPRPRRTSARTSPTSQTPLAQAVQTYAANSDSAPRQEPAERSFPPPTKGQEIAGPLRQAAAPSQAPALPAGTDPFTAAREASGGNLVNVIRGNQSLYHDLRTGGESATFNPDGSINAAAGGSPNPSADMVADTFTAPAAKARYKNALAAGMEPHQAFAEGARVEDRVNEASEKNKLDSWDKLSQQDRELAKDYREHLGHLQSMRAKITDDQGNLKAGNRPDSLKNYDDSITDYQNRLENTVQRLSLPRPPKPGTVASANIIQSFLKAAGGDREEAQRRLEAAGWGEP